MHPIIFFCMRYYWSLILFCFTDFFSQNFPLLSDAETCFSQERKEKCMSKVHFVFFFGSGQSEHLSKLPKPKKKQEAETCNTFVFFWMFFLSCFSQHISFILEHTQRISKVWPRFPVKKNASSNKREINLLTRKCVESSLISRSSTINLRLISYHISPSLANPTLKLLT